MHMLFSNIPLLCGLEGMLYCKILTVCDVPDSSDDVCATLSQTLQLVLVVKIRRKLLIDVLT